MPYPLMFPLTVPQVQRREGWETVHSLRRRHAGPGSRRLGQKGKRSFSPQRERNRPREQQEKEGRGWERRDKGPPLPPQSAFSHQLRGLCSRPCTQSHSCLQRAMAWEAGIHGLLSGPRLRVGKVTPIGDPLLSHPHPPSFPFSSSRGMGKGGRYPAGRGN